MNRIPQAPVRPVQIAVREAPLLSSLGPMLRSARPTGEPEPPRDPLAPKEPKSARFRAKRAAQFAAAAVLAAAGAFTVVRMSAPEAGSHQRREVVSGSADPRQTPTGVSERWAVSDISVVLDGSLETTDENVHEAVVRAFGTWLSGVRSLPKVSFDSKKSKVVRLERDGENRIYFAPITVPGHTGNLAITIAYADTETGDILETDIIINSRAAWSAGNDQGNDEKDDGDAPKGGSGTSGNHSSMGKASSPASEKCRDRYDLDSVVTHEVGHFFGLDEDFTDTTATMYVSTPPCVTRQRDLGPNDVREMQKLYAGAVSVDPSGDEKPGNTSAKAMKCSTSPQGGEGPGFVVLACVALLGARRARSR